MIGQFKVGSEADSGLGGELSRFPLTNTFLTALEDGFSPFWAESRAIRVLETIEAPLGLLSTWSESRFIGRASRFGDFLPLVSQVPSVDGGAK